MGFDKLNKARIVLGIMTNKDSLHGFVAAVIEASFDWNSSGGELGIWAVYMA